ncbi:hypothetical protein BC937DRAFT_91681 [Endogone sp. FLAS-F59071]|nr:hypothetical protein BC937DRAFT_91681 [Endogone sp. FLAS-F59071]|eukprot:RUS16026.1 hypothetical protein BC937DRAFT_91681 [Endogone sp. FLAS-F59071]
MEGQMRVPPDYEQAFQRAELTFQYQRVYDIDTCTLTTLTPVPEGMDVGKMDFLGPRRRQERMGWSDFHWSFEIDTDAWWVSVSSELDLETARRIAMGDLNPITKQPIVDLSAGVLEDKENRERKPTLPLQRNRKPFQPSTTTNAMPIVSYFSILFLCKLVP